MTHLLRGKQSGIQNDLSAGLTQELFIPDHLSRFGINSQVSCLAYDPVQSLLAVGTKSSQFGPGQIYIFGRTRIEVVLPLSTQSQGAHVQTLQFCAEKLVCLDSKHDISVYSLELKSLLASHSPPGHVTVLCTDPMLDYAMLGMQTGDVMAYDLDRENLAPFRIPNLWADIDPRARVSPVVSLQFHPRDIGTLLIGYAHGAVIYSFKLNKAVRHFAYEVPQGAPGGDGDPALANTVRRPKLVHAVWHPTGTFVLTAHEDSSLVFWDTIKDGRMLMSRTITDTNIATPAAGAARGTGGVMAVKEPLFKISWCANQDPEDTALLIAGGQSTQSPTKGLTLFEMGRTPVYATSTWESLSQYFEEPKRQRILPTPPGAEVVAFCPIPRASPHFAGAHDPIAVIALLGSGELLTLTFPSGMPICPTNQLHPSLTFVHPFIKSVGVCQVERERWLGMTERRQQGPPILNGGAEGPGRHHRFGNRNVAHTVHADGTIRIFDVGYGDEELENPKVLQADVGRALGRYDGAVGVTAMSLAGGSGEMAVGVHSGQLVIFRWGHNKHAGREPAGGPRPTQPPGHLSNITDRAEPSLSEGIVPFTMLDQQNGPVTAVKVSEVGFIAAGTEGGSITILDMRGPAIIYAASVAEFSKGEKKGSLRKRRNSETPSKPEWVTSIEFSIMTLEGEDYSSILCHCGTNQGHLATFKIVPDPSGRYTVQPAGSPMHLSESRILHIAPINAETGNPAIASPAAMGGLKSGSRINGALVVVTPTSLHISRPPGNKGAHKSFDSVFCDAAGIVRYQDQGHALVGLFGDGFARAYSIPQLRELATIQISDTLDTRRFGDAVIVPSGHILGFTGPSELALVNIFGAGEDHVSRGTTDRLFNPEALIPPRPTISTVQWVTGTQYITPTDMDILIGGPDRPPSKRMVAQSRAEEEQRRRAARATATGSSSSGPANAAGGQGQGQEGYWAYMQRQLQERTEKLGIIGDSMENLEQNSANWSDEVGKFVKQQKRSAAGGILKAKFGF
ncbi:snare-dependent exocytosis protein-like protein [Hortaea werneckii]|nr:snare-dependent exocytosis protein-like protein [Hortaea werneckii]